MELKNHFALNLKQKSLSPKALKSFLNAYKLAPINNVLRNEESQLFAQDGDSFFLKVVPSSVYFEKDTSGTVTGMVLHQGGRDISGKKVNYSAYAKK